MYWLRKNRISQAKQDRLMEHFDDSDKPADSETRPSQLPLDKVGP